MKQLIPIALVLALLATAGSSLAAIEAVGVVAGTVHAIGNLTDTLGSIAGTSTFSAVFDAAGQTENCFAGAGDHYVRPALPTTWNGLHTLCMSAAGAGAGAAATVGPIAEVEAGEVIAAADTLGGVAASTANQGVGFAFVAAGDPASAPTGAAAFAVTMALEKQAAMVAFLNAVIEA